MGIVLGPNRYGKAENRVVRIYRDTARHEIRDLNVSTSLRGDFAAAHIDGDQSQVLPTDTQKNTAFAYAKQHGVSSPEDYALGARHAGCSRRPRRRPAPGSQVEEYAWDRIPVAGAGHDHAFVRRGGEVRTTVVDVTAGRGHRRRPASSDLVVLKSTGSEFKGFLRDEYTTLPEADDRILATVADRALALRPTRADGSTGTRRTPTSGSCCSRRSPTTYSRALQETLYAMGSAVLEAHAGGRRDLLRRRPTSTTSSSTSSPFGLDNDGEVFIAADRPYGLIEATGPPRREPVS